MSTIPYPDEEHPGHSESPSPRLIIALSCTDPLRLVNDWSVQSIELDGAADVNVGRGSDGFELVRAKYVAAEVIMITIPDVHLSTQHMRLTREPTEPGDAERWQLHDAGSMNGTWVNGERVTEATLQDNDVIAIGATILLYRTTSQTPSTAAATAASTSVANGRPQDPRFAELRTLNPELATTLATLHQIAPSNLAILVSGQTGVGKEVVAHAIHRLSRRSGPFVPINCSAVPPALIASELFGVQKGAFSGAHKSRQGLIRSAHRGTLFLDEIAELPMECQAVLLRVLQDGQVTPVGGATPIDVDMRVLAATHQDLPKRVEDGTFREDLLIRLRGLAVTLPPLRERREDIGLLMAQILPGCLKERGPTPHFSRRAGAQMFIYHWPGNVRELKKTLHAAVLLAPDGKICLEHLPASIARARPMPTAPTRPQSETDTLEAAPPQRQREADTVEAAPARRPRDADTIRALYTSQNGNLSAMARVLDTSRTQVRRLLKRHGIYGEN